MKKLNKPEHLKFVLPIVFGLLFFFFNRLWLPSLLYVLGWYAGMALLIADKKKLYLYYFQSIHENQDKFARLITRSLLFIMAYVVLTIFMLTSSGSSFGMGLVLGIGVILAEEMWLSRNYGEFFNHYFIQGKKTWTNKEINWLVGGFLVFFIISCLFSVS